jgi:hypothetical protein
MATQHPARTLVEILTEVVAHDEDQPTHGSNCACMDKYIREIWRQIDAAIPTPESDWERRIGARSRMAYLLRVVGSRL